MQMNAIDRLLAFVFGTSDEVADGMEELREALRPPTRGIDLQGYVSGAALDRNGADTAVFEVVLETPDGEVYGSTNLEFEVPQEGLAAEGARLNDFLQSFGIDAADSLDEIVGESVEVENEDGHWKVQWE